MRDMSPHFTKKYFFDLTKLRFSSAKLVPLEVHYGLKGTSHVFVPSKINYRINRGKNRRHC